MSTLKTLLALSTGVALGTAIGILLAPDKGEVTREKLREKSGEAVDKLNEKYTEVKDDLLDKFNKGSDEAKKVAKKVSGKVKSYKPSAS